jgi:tRNA (cytidine/uridine-2'-O-)-methyltransferase
VRKRSYVSAVRQLHIALLSPEIHWNTGNIGRTALAVAAQLHLIEPLGFSLQEKQVRRAGLDYWERVNPQVYPDWDTFARAIPALGEPWYFSAAGERDYWDVDFGDRVVAVFGRESVGLPRPLLEANRARTLRIPMRDPQLRSLNLSTAAALVAYEVARQWRRR